MCFNMGNGAKLSTLNIFMAISHNVMPLQGLRKTSFLIIFHFLSLEALIQFTYKAGEKPHTSKMTVD